MKFEKEFKDLLTAFEQIPKTEVSPPTFMEIAGYPHYENVCSNILAFFFDTNEVHGFGDLFVRSLYECLREETPATDDLQTINVSREVPTSSGKRIDILIETDNYVFAIENKIWHHLHNDLADYAKHAQKVAKEEKKEILLIILSPYGVHSSLLHSGFISLTFENLFDKVKEQLGKYLHRGTSAYLPQLTDFMETMLNHTKKTPMNLEMINFLIKEKETIDTLIKERNKVYGTIIRKVKQVKNLIDGGEHKQWVYDKFCLVHDIQISDKLTIAVDTWFLAEGIETTIFVRSRHKDKAALLTTLEVYSDKYTLRADSRIVYRAKDEMSIMTPNKEIANMIAELLPQIKLKNV